jgi:hypothetical protein
MPEGEAVKDDPAIPDECGLLRSFSPQFVVAIQGGGVRPSSQAFQKITDKATGERAMSVYRADILEELGIEYEAIIEKHPDHLIVRIPTKMFRDLELGIVPKAGSDRPGPAHCHVSGQLSGSKRDRLANAVVGGEGSWIKGPAEVLNMPAEQTDDAASPS